jgi:hypothetical protein
VSRDCASVELHIQWLGVNFLVFTFVLDHLLSFGGIIKGKNTKSFDILFGWQQLGVFGVLVITFFLEEIMLMLIP